MHRFTPATILTCLLALTLTACGDSDSGKPLSGAELVAKKCANCHSLDRDMRKSGPTLKGIFGSTPSISGVPYSTWDEASLDAWIESPLTIKRGTRMAIPGIKSAAERAAIIAHLKTL